MKKSTQLLFILMALILVLSNPGLRAQGAQPGPAGESAAPQAASLYSANLSGYAPNPTPGGLDLSGYIQVPYSSAINFSGGALTIEAWVKRNTTNRFETLVGNGYGTNFWMGFSATGKLRFTPYGYTYVMDSNATIPAGVWTHVAVTYGANATRTYLINGVVDLVANYSGPVLPDNPAHPPLDIGRDRDNPSGVNYFGGQIDELRIWRTVRTPTQVHGAMFARGGPATSLLAAEWRMDGNAQDSTGSNNGIPIGVGVTYLTDSALPHSLMAPQTSSTMTLDGVCASATEYASSVSAGFGSVTAYIQHSATDLWICLDNVGAGSTSAEIYLDPQLTQQDPAQPEHYRLSLPYGGALSSAAGDGAGNFSAAPSIDGQWSAQTYNTGGGSPTRSTEFRISSSLLGGWDHQIGLAINTGLAANNGWPVMEAASQPSTWAKVTLGGAGTLRTFSGSVVYRPKTSGSVTESPVGSVTINLIGYAPTGGEAVVGSTLSDQNGNFSVSCTDSFAYHRLQLAAPPTGMDYLAAVAPQGASVLDKRTIDFTNIGAGAHPGAVFKVTDTRPAPLDPTGAGPVYLVIAKQSMIDSGALDLFIDFKTRLGFEMVTQSLEYINALTGSIQAQKIRNYEKTLRATYGTRFKYVLLVGGTDVTLPPVKLYPYINGSGDGKCSSPKAAFKWSDWYFVDLVSNFNSNGDNCWADGIWATPLAMGFTPDAGIKFEHDVSVGRVPFDDPVTVRNTLGNSIGFERQSYAYKGNVMLAMSMLAMKGYNDYDQPCTDWTNGHCAPPNTSANFDMAFLAQVMQLTTYDPLLYYTKGFYEDNPAIAGGSGIISNPPLDPVAIQTELNAHRYGFVAIDGHGNSDGVFRVYWKGDSNHNGLPNTSEQGTGNLFTVDEVKNLTPTRSQGGVYYISACGAADPTVPANFTYSLVSHQNAVAAIGAYNIITVSAWNMYTFNGMAQDTLYAVNYAIFNDNARLGDALWGVESAQIAMSSAGSGRGSGLVGMVLVGDPALSYQGGPGAGVANASWSMLRRESTGQAYFPLPGPQNPKSIWEYNTADATQPAVSRPSPVANADGEVIVPGGSSLRVLAKGSLYQSLPLNAAAYGSPALAADGTLYAVDVNGTLYAFTYNTAGSHVRSQRWYVPLMGTPITSPTIGPDGSILVGISSILPGLSQLAVVRPDGHLQEFYTEPGTIQAAVTTSADRGVIIATRNFANGLGYIIREEPACYGIAPCSAVTYAQLSGFTTAPLLAYGYLYVGDVSGKVTQMDPHTLQVIHTYATGSQITAGPVAGPGDQVLVGTLNGGVYSLTANLVKRWNRSLATGITSVPAFSEDGLYLTAGGSLIALNPTSGATLWTRSLNGAGEGSVAVGYGRELYLLTSSGKVKAFGEGWPNPVLDFQAIAGKVELRPANLLTWAFAIPPTLNNAPQASTVGLLLERSKDGNDWEPIAYLPPTATAFNDLAIASDASYQYRLQVLDNAGGESDYTNSPDPVQSLPVAPGAPTLNTATPLSSSSIKINWTTPAGSQVDGYYIFTSTDPAIVGWTLLTTVAGQAQDYTITGLTANSTHYYRVAGYNATWIGPVSGTKDATTLTQDLPAPTNPTAQLLAGGEIKLTWGGRPAGALAVVEVRPFGGGDFTALDPVDADTLSTFPSDPNIYEFRIKFIQGGHESSYASANAIVIKATYLIFMPAIQK